MLASKILTLLFIIAATIVPAVADEGECISSTSMSLETFSRDIQENYPELEEKQVSVLANLSEFSRLQQALAEDQEATPEMREFAALSSQIVTDLGWLQTYAFEVHERTTSVLKDMKAEKEAGLKQASTSLKLRLRVAAAGNTALMLGLRDMGKDMIPFFKKNPPIPAFIDEGDDGSTTVAQVSRILCLVKAISQTTDSINGAVNAFSEVSELFYEEEINY